MNAEQERELLLREKAERRKAEEKETLRAEKARRSLAQFVKCIWPIVEPSKELEWSWHLDAFCLHLEHLYRGDIQNLAISTPAGTTKTIVIMQAFVAWCWIHDPGLRFLCCANTKDLAIQSSIQCREIIGSEWYQKHFPHVQISTETDARTWFGTTARGYRRVGVVGHKVTGQKSDILLIDDANDADEVHSKEIRDSIISWWDQSCYDRVNDFMTSKRVIVGHRTHKDDLIGHCVAKYNFGQLVVTEEYDPTRSVPSPIGWKDPRTAAGELLRPKRFGPEQVAQAKKLPTWQTKHQQNPVDAANAVYKPEYLRRRWYWHPSRPNVIVLEASDADRYEFDVTRCPLFAACDAAADAKSTSDDTALGVYNLTPRGDLVWRHLYLRKLDIPDQPKLLGEAWDRWRFAFIAVEAAGANRAMFQFAERMGLAAVPMHSGSADKLVRAQPAILRAAAGRLWLPDDGVCPDWDVQAAVEQLTRFTGKKGEPDDIADQLSWACHAAPHAARFAGGDDTAAPVAVDPTRGPRFMGDRDTPRFGRVAAVSPDSVRPTGGSRVMPWG